MYRSCFWVFFLLLSFNGCTGDAESSSYSPTSATTTTVTTATCWENERRALLQIKSYFNNPNGTSLESWRKSNCCEWEEVECDLRTSRVVGLHLGSIRSNSPLLPLNATLFTPFAGLGLLDLSFNNLGGTSKDLANFSKLTNLRSLDLSGNTLNDSTLPWLFTLTNLKLLNLRHNKLNRSILPYISSLSKLEDLDLSYNNLQGPVPIQELSALKKLRSIGLRGAGLNGSIPPSLSKNSLLEILDLSGNLLVGNIPSSLGELSSLRALDLYENQLQGNIPPTLGFLAYLEELLLFGNQLDGSIPSSLGHLSSIKYIDISNNTFEGSIYFSMFSNLSELTAVDFSGNTKLGIHMEHEFSFPSFHLFYFNFSSCHLNGNINNILHSFLYNQYSLYEIDLSHNNLTGEIPKWLLTNLVGRLVLRNNSLVGTFPLPRKPIPYAWWIDVSNNKINGQLPFSIGFLLPNITCLNMSGNSLQGRIPSSLGNMKSLRFLDLSNNMFSGEIPQELTIGGSKELLFLMLSNNKLSGQMLPNDSNLTKLLFLHLDGNGFTGKFSPYLLNSPQLQRLNIGRNNMLGAIPPWISSFAELRALDLRENHFHGSILNQLCQLQKLQILNLARNDFDGSIPRCFYNVSTWARDGPQSKFENIPDLDYLAFLEGPLSALGFGPIVATSSDELDFSSKGREYEYTGIVLNIMTGIDLSMNQLRGHIPVEMGFLKWVKAINLSNNHLTGSIPASFGNLDEIESLDLSYNHLSGNIPPQLVKLTALSSFIVAHNNLSGKIPSGNQFNTFTQDYFVGNPYLCGEPLKENCWSDHGKENWDEEKSKSANYDLLKFYGSMAISYSLTFWGFLGLLFFNRRWRRNYFNAMDRCIESSCELMVASMQILRKVWKCLLD